MELLQISPAEPSIPCTKGPRPLILQPVKLVLAVLLAASAFSLGGCADIPDADDVHEQQLQRSYAAPGQPIRPPEAPDTPPSKSVPGE